MKAIRTSAASRNLESKRRMTQSERARMQPRDSRGRFAGFDTVLVVDEFGNPGPSQKSERKFGYALSVTSSPDVFGMITDDNRWDSPIDDRWGSPVEKKARDDKDSRMKIVRRISSKGVQTYAYYVDKDDPPTGWEGKDRRHRMLDVLDYSIDRTLDETRGDVYVVVDQHNAYKGFLKPMIRSKSTGMRMVDGDKFDSNAGPCSDLLQTHDYVANAVRADVELGDDSRTRVLGTKIRRIRGNDLVRRH